MKVQIRICRHLYNMLKEVPVKGMLHSCFRSSMNMVCQYGMITFLAKGKSLQPFSICLEWNGDFKLIEEMLRLRGTELQLSDQGLWIGNFQLFEFEITQILDLKKSQTETLKPGAANFIRSFLEHQEDKGIHGLIEGRKEEVFSAFLAPRIQAFRQAVQEGNMGSAVLTAEQMAGCGPGLTPSSDDFLCGYVASWPDEKPWKGFLKEITNAAALKTNDISGSLLKHAGENMFSEDILQLLKGFESCDPALIRTALKRVSSFGSSSGCDFLTGMYYGVIDSNKMGGNRCGKA